MKTIKLTDAQVKALQTALHVRRQNLSKAIEYNLQNELGTGSLLDDLHDVENVLLAVDGAA
jgi:hypothetical protein